MVRVPKVTSEKTFLTRGIHCCIIFPDQASFFFKNTNVYEDVEIVHDYHDYQMMLQVNHFLYKPEVVRSYWLPKQVS
jgi:hypothetical protein